MVVVAFRLAPLPWVLMLKIGEAVVEVEAEEMMIQEMVQEEEVDQRMNLWRAMKVFLKAL